MLDESRGNSSSWQLRTAPSPGFKSLKNFDFETIVKTFMLKLQQNSGIWQIYCIKQPKSI
ncbi:hypothetical protein BpHYR1_016857 [Brachionus plicatilis]|uniref:Uncharacterized protein n=1 Tax=Brachionus plicatilis TaxID=10195 RepID=A0A3M7PSG4_BRAPC|nr:hypothetical protein BpHYR1_016857 [Brachionus plicatilis]